MNRKSSTILFGSLVIGILIMLAIYMGLIVTGVIDTRPSALVVVAGSAQREYDGTPLVCEEYTLKNGKLKRGHELQVSFDAELTDVGETENAISVKVVDAIGADVTNHYKIETRSGKLTVTPRRLVIKSGDTEKMYDGEPLMYEMWDIVVGQLSEDHTARATFTGEQVIPGTSNNSFVVSIYDRYDDSVDRNYEVSYIFGKLHVTKRPITVTSYGASKEYDGAPLVCESFTTEGEVLYGHYLNVEFPASIINVGTMTNNIEVSIYSDYEDVTSYYDVSVRVGELEITKRPIEFSTSRTCDRNFSGDVFPECHAIITKGSLVAGHAYDIPVIAKKNDMGTVEYFLDAEHAMIFEGYFLDSVIHNNPYYDVTGNYEITLVHAIDREQLVPLTFASLSKSAPYTGQPLVCEQYTQTAGELAEGHQASAIFTGQQTEIGFSPNNFTVIIIDTMTGEDVTYRYNITYEYGRLEVYGSAPLTGGEISDDGSLGGDAENPGATAARVYVTQSGRVYLRWKSYGDYAYRESTDDWGWGEAGAYPLATSNMLFTVGQVLAASGKAPVEYQIELLGNQFLLPNYVSEGPEGAHNDVVLSPISTAYTMTGYDWEYSATEMLYYMELDPAYIAFVANQYLHVPESTRLALLEIAAANRLRPGSATVIEDVANYVRSAAVYDMDYPVCPEGEDEVIWFLTESGSGVCRHFASAATLMYRALGIPARYVVGYSAYAAGGEWTDIKGADAHAWVEVYVAGIGWVRIDPTPSVGGSATSTLVFTPVTIKKNYTGDPFDVRPDQVSMQGKLKPGHYFAEDETVVGVIGGPQTEAGTYITVIDRVFIRDENGQDVTDEYKIVLQKGILEIKKPTLKVIAASEIKKFDGQPLQNPIYTVDPPVAYRVTASVTGEQMGVGESRNVASDAHVYDHNGVDITHNFVIEYVDGTLKVYLYDLTLVPSSDSKVYDGTPLSAPDLNYDQSVLAANGHVLQYTMPSITDAGAIYNTPDYCILDASTGEDVSDQYNVRITPATLIIAPISVTILTNSASKQYDGTALEADGFEVLEGGWIEGHRIESFGYSDTQTNVGSCDVTVTGMVIVDAFGHNVTANYQINILPGTLTVLAP